MRSTPPSRSNGSLRPLTIPELRYPPLSPSPADAGFSSPESDSIMTPLTGHALHSFPRSRSSPRPSLSAHTHVKINDGSPPRAAYEQYVAMSPPCLPQLPPLDVEPTCHRNANTNSFYVPSQALDLINESFETGPFVTPFPETPSSAKQAGFSFLSDASPSSSSGFVPTTTTPPTLTSGANLNANLYSRQFPLGHILNVHFVNAYSLGDELGSGGYGFVMTAHHRGEGHEVAVKFIIKRKVPEHAWVEEESIGRLPTEIMLLSLIDHENIVKCLDVFEDDLYFYLVQELHGSPWQRSRDQNQQRRLSHGAMSSPALCPSSSEESVADTELGTPPPSTLYSNARPQINESGHLYYSPRDDILLKPSQKPRPSLPLPSDQIKSSRRPSHDLFECIEQSKHKRLTEVQARYIFAQVVEAVYYLDGQGISHRDIKDENLVIDKHLKVKLIDFGSAIISNPLEPRPFYELFLGTPAYAASEILLKKPYQAPPAEIWTLGVLLSYLLTGMSPFLTQEDAMYGRITLVDKPDAKPSWAALSLMRWCLDPDPTKRACIQEVRAHWWLRGALDNAPPYPI